ncbi:MAG: hypothetical protein ACTSQI_17355 [Candidatus Helarchaeota archaeon]
MATTQVVVFAFIFELIGAIFLSIIGSIVFKRYLEYKRVATLSLALGIFLAGISILISSIGRLVALMNGITPLYHGYQYTPFVWIPLALTFNVIADIFFLIFTNHVFFAGTRKFSIIAAILGVTVAILFIPLVPTPNLVASEPPTSYTDLFQLVWLVQALLTFITGGLIMWKALTTAKKADTLVQKRGMQILGILGLGLGMANIMFIIDELLTPYFGGNFSAFYYLGWIFVHLGIVCAYLGFILPDWLRKRWE